MSGGAILRWGAVVLWAALGPGAALADARSGDAVLRICAGGHPGFSIGPDPLARGPLTVPRGTAFRFSGFDLDLSMPDAQAGLASDGYAKRHDDRQRRLRNRLSDNAALTTRREARLTRARRCAAVPVAALLSPRFGWSTAPVESDGQGRFKPYGVVEHGHLDLSYGNAGGPFRHAAIRGEIEATLRGRTGSVVRLAKRNLDVLAHHRRHRHR